MTGNSKKIISAFLIALIIFSSVSLAVPKTSALFGIDEMLRQIFVGIKDVAVKRLVTDFTNETVKWIQGGGEPKFVTDPVGFFSDVGDEAIGEFINNDENFKFLCSPFRAQLQVTLPYLVQPSEQGPAACTLTGVIGNIENFFDDFEDGGWIAFTQASQPNNNFIGSLLILDSQVAMKASAKQEAKKQEVQAGGGFLSVKRCIEHNKDGTCKREEIVTPGRFVSDTISKATGAEIDFANSIDSLIGAALNMVIGQITGAGQDRGLGYARKSSPGDDTDELNRRVPHAAADLNGRFLREWETRLSSKKRSFDSAEKIVGTLEALQVNNCRPAVTSAQIGFAEDEMKRLTEESADLQAKVNLANKIVRDLGAIGQGGEDWLRQSFGNLAYAFFTGGTEAFNTTMATMPGGAFFGRMMRQAGLLDRLISDFGNVGVTVVFRDLTIITQFDGFDTEAFRRQFATGSERERARNEATEKINEYTELLERHIECVGVDAYRNVLVGKVKPAHDGWEAIISSKNKSSSHIAESIGNLTNLQREGCTLAGQRNATEEQKREVASAIAAARNTRETISKDISGLRPGLKEAVEALDAIRKAEDASSLIDVTDDALAFERKYVENAHQRATWSQAAQQEAAAQALELQGQSDAHKRAWEICRPSPAAPGA